MARMKATRTPVQLGRRLNAVARPHRVLLQRAAIAGASSAAVLLVLWVVTQYGAAAVLWMFGALLLAGLAVLQWLAVRQLRAKPDAELTDALLRSTWVTRWLHAHLHEISRHTDGSHPRADAPEDD